MHKYASFAIMAAVFLTAIVTVTLYAVDRAYAQGNETSATGGEEHNMTNAAGGEEHNMTNAAGGEEHNMTNAAGGEEHNMTNAAGGEEHNMTNATKEVAAVGTCITIGRGDAAHAVC